MGNTKITIPILLLLLLFYSLIASAQQKKEQEKLYPATVVNGDTIAIEHLPPVYVYGLPLDLSKYKKLIRNIKIVYPIAKRAKERFEKAGEELEKIDNKGDRKAYIKRMEEELKAEYTPILRQMTFSQGKVLIKLIDRETQSSPYEIVKDLRGGFSAMVWQGVARVFGANLKDTYDEDGADKIMERIIVLYEAGSI